MSMSVVERPWEHWCAPAAAEDYDRGRFHSLHGRLYRWREERVIAQALRGVQPESTVLDVACGTGRIMALLLRNALRPTGCDISTAMMGVARRRMQSLGAACDLIETEAQHLPFEDKSFDAVTCIGLLMHLNGGLRVKILRELARVSRGRLVVQYGRTGALPQLKSYLTGNPSGLVAHPVSEDELRADLQRSGLTEQARFWPLPGVSSSLVVVLTS
jgi:ubiquinone/menaquinone biosynthesis C-methylase UbiE